MTMVERFGVFLLYVSGLVVTASGGPSGAGAAGGEGSAFFSPKSSDDFKAAPVVELTRSNSAYIIGAQKCTVVFSSPMFLSNEDKPKVQELRAISSTLANRFRSNPNVLVAHVAADTEGKTLAFPYEEGEHFETFVKWSEMDVPIVVARASKKRGVRLFGARKDKVQLSADGVVAWVEKKCKEAGSPEHEKYDYDTLSVIFKTNKTLALLADGFDLVSEDMKAWIQDYCADFPIPQEFSPNVTVLDARTTSMRKFLCLHAFAGRPLVMKNAVGQWPAMHKWKPDGPWVDMMASAALSADIGVERGWRGRSLSSYEYFEYMQDNAAERARLRYLNVTMPPWSSLYAYTHQHTRTEDGFVADIMWPDFEAPDIFNRQNWFRYMGDCHKMMTVTFWATEGARQSNHQDDFGSSKWQAQVYGRKRWIMHPPEESKKLYNGRGDPFEPDYERYPDYKDVRRVEFVLEEGDVLFWSAGWWHATQALENSLAIAQNILSEHNYMEFRRTSRNACEPGGSHGVYSPWCSCFRRTYGKWDEMYKKWLDDIKANSPGRDYDFSKFMSHNESPTEHTHADLASGIGNVLKALNGDVDHFTEKNEFPIDTAHTDL